MNRAAFGSRFGEYLWGVAALGQPLCRGVLGSSFGKQLRGTVWGASLANFPEQLWGTIALKNSSFGGQLSGAALQATLGSSFQWQLAFGSRFAE